MTVLLGHQQFTMTCCALGMAQQKALLQPTLAWSVHLPNYSCHALHISTSSVITASCIRSSSWHVLMHTIVQLACPHAYDCPVGMSKRKQGSESRSLPCDAAIKLWSAGKVHDLKKKHLNNMVMDGKLPLRPGVCKFSAQHYQFLS